MAAHVLTVDINLWRQHTRYLSPGAVALALHLSILSKETRYQDVPHPDMFELTDWGRTLRLDDPESTWQELLRVLPQEDGHCQLPWLVRDTKVTPNKRPAAWKSWLLKEPLASDPLFRDAWTAFHEMKTTLRHKPWVDDTCELWLTKKLQRYGRDVLILSLEQSTEQQWQGLFPEKFVREHNLGYENAPNRGTQSHRRDKIHQWMRQREKRLYGYGDSGK